jgi:hypothetical protein
MNKIIMANTNINKKSFFYLQDYQLTNIQENIEMFGYAIVSFIFPMLLSHPQLLVGSVVNSALVLSALNLKGYKTLPVILLPSIGVFTAGLIFGSLTKFLLYIIPFIWIGNALFVFSIKKLNLENRMNKYYGIIVSIIIKCGFLFLSTYVMVKLNILPVVFLTSMGIFQVYTALIGASFALVVQQVKKKFA